MSQINVRWTSLHPGGIALCPDNLRPIKQTSTASTSAACQWRFYRFVKMFLSDGNVAAVLGKKGGSQDGWDKDSTSFIMTLILKNKCRVISISSLLTYGIFHMCSNNLFFIRHLSQCWTTFFLQKINSTATPLIISHDTPGLRPASAELKCQRRRSCHAVGQPFTLTRRVTLQPTVNLIRRVFAVSD